MSTRVPNDIDREDVVELHPKSSLDEPFKGQIIEMRSGEIVLKPTDHCLEPNVLGINLHINKDQFSVLVKDSNAKDTRVYSLDSIRVYDSNGNQVFSDKIREGMVVYDKNCPDWSDDERLKVINITDETAREHHIDNGSTVYDYNPDYPADDIVIEGQYVSGGNKTYAFPESRLTTDQSEVQ